LYGILEPNNHTVNSFFITVVVFEEKINSVMNHLKRKADEAFCLFVFFQWLING